MSRDGGQQEAEEEQGQRIFQLAQKEFHHRQEAMFGAVAGKEIAQLDEGFPHVAPLPAQVHVADPAVGFGDQGVDHRGALVAGVVAGPQDKISQGPVFAVAAGGPQKGLPPPGGQDGHAGRRGR